MSAKRVSEIKEAIALNDVSKARRLISVALKDQPDEDIYYLASQVALDDNQKKEFLDKALELDPFHEEANNDLSKKQTPSLPKDIELDLKDHKRNTNNFKYYAEWFLKQSSLTKLYIIGIGTLIVFILPISWVLNNNQSSKTDTLVIPTKPTTYTPSETTVNSQPAGSSDNPKDYVTDVNLHCTMSDGRYYFEGYATNTSQRLIKVYTIGGTFGSTVLSPGYNNVSAQMELAHVEMGSDGETSFIDCEDYQDLQYEWYD